MCGGAGLYKPSSLLHPHIANTSALPMLELGLMPVVTTMGGDSPQKATGESGLTALGKRTSVWSKSKSKSSDQIASAERS